MPLFLTAGRTHPTAATLPIHRAEGSAGRSTLTSRRNTAPAGHIRPTTASITTTGI